MKKALIISLSILVILLFGCNNADNSYEEVSWQGIFDKDSGERISIEGYLTDAAQYPSNIVREDETYQFISPNNDYPVQVQIPLIISSQIDCSGKIEIDGIAEIREGLAGIGMEGKTMYMMVVVDNWRCI